MPNSNSNNHLRELLELARKSQASDLHLSSGYKPVLRIDGILLPIAKEKELSSEDTEALVKSLMRGDMYSRFLEEKEIDLKDIPF